MVFIKPDIEAGTIQDRADLMTMSQYPEPDTDEEPDVEEIEVSCIFRNEEYTPHKNPCWAKKSKK